MTKLIDEWRRLSGILIEDDASFENQPETNEDVEKYEKKQPTKSRASRKLVVLNRADEVGETIRTLTSILANNEIAIAENDNVNFVPLTSEQIKLLEDAVTILQTLVQTLQ